MKKNSKKIPRTLSLFSGAGGLDIGFKNIGFDIVASLELEEAFCKTLKANQNFFGESHKVLCADISETNPEELKIGKIDLIIGGPPCQSFSAAGRRAGGVHGVNDKRGNLFSDYCRFLKHFKPKVFVFENVRGILQANNKEDWERIQKAFSEVGYGLDYRVLDAACYGVPQHRERVILVGQLKKTEDFLFPRPTHGPLSNNGLDYYTAGEAIEDIFSEEEVVPPYGGKYGDLLDEVPPGTNYLYFTEKMGHPEPKFAWRSRFSDFLYKADPKAPVRTIVAYQGKFSGPFHWKSRKFTMHELARLQSFPDHYKIIGSDQIVVRQIGNSVAPLFGETIAKAIDDQFFQMNLYEIDYLSSDEVLKLDKRKGKKARATKQKVSLNKSSDKVITVKTRRKITEEVVSYKDKRVKANRTFILNGALKSKVWNVEIEEDTELKSLFSMNFSIENVNSEYISFNTIKGTFTASSLWAIQGFWESINVIISASSSYTDIRPLYGHFTEPYPKFDIEFGEINGTYEKNFYKFLKFTEKFENMSKIESLSSLGRYFSHKNKSELVRSLRLIGYDLRVNETNRTIPEGKFRLCYPFTLPVDAKKSVTWKEKGQHRTADL